jgi:ribonuclease HIII
MTQIGLDEAGKGEYFGPLVVAGFYLEQKQSFIDDLSSFATDSKKFSRNKIDHLFQYINFHYPHNYIAKVITPFEYNDLYEDKNNQLHIITDAYNEVIKDFYTKTKIDNFVIDKYSSSRYTQSTFNSISKDLDINIFQENKADLNYLSVSVASIIAKYYYNLFINTKSEECGIDLSVGSSKLAIPTARQICEKYDFSDLKYFVKLHFKTTRQL